METVVDKERRHERQHDLETCVVDRSQGNELSRSRCDSVRVSVSEPSSVVAVGAALAEAQ